MIVTRGLGYGGILVTAGLALTLGIIVVPPDVVRPPESWNYTEGPKRKYVIADVAVTVSIPVVRGRGLLADIEARGSAYVGLYMPSNSHGMGTFQPSGAATASIIGVRADTQLGQILASGQHDMEDEDILAMLLTLLDSESLV